METTVSSKGQIVLPAEARKRLRLAQGERLSVELRDGGVFLRPVGAVRTYRMEIHPVSGLPVMVAEKRGGRKVTAAEIARLNAELL
jgi:AbrB family looped-hinge helix DNA binding protein